MAHWLILAATLHETRLIREQVGFDAGQLFDRGFWKGKEIHLLYSGVGMTNTAYALGKYLAHFRPERAIQLGIGGAFEKGPGIGEVVQIHEEIFPEMGAESPAGFLDMKDLGMVLFQKGEQTYYNRISQPNPPLPQLRACVGSTVNTVHGKPDSIQQIQQIWNPEVESMEGAAFFQVCIQENLPFHEIRSISNRVESRNKDAWDIPGAVMALNRYFLDKMDFDL